MTPGGAERTADNLRVTISRDMQRYFEIHSILLRDVAEDLKEPGISQEKSAHYRFLSRAVELAHYPGSMLILDVDGNIVADSAGPTPRTASFRDRDYFRSTGMGAMKGFISAGLFAAGSGMVIPVLRCRCGSRTTRAISPAF